MKAKDKFRVNWSKRENDLMYHYPLGQCTKADGHWLSGIFDKEFEAELSLRGYDIKTIRFSIEPKQDEERFASQRKKAQS